MNYAPMIKICRLALKVTLQLKKNKYKSLIFRFTLYDFSHRQSKLELKITEGNQTHNVCKFLEQ